MKKIKSEFLTIKDNNISIHEKINLGILLLRFILCSWVVVIHSSVRTKNNIKLFSKPFHVPTFFMLSFYFYFPTISRKNISKIKARFERLIYPYIFWPIITLTLNNILIKFTSLGKFRNALSIKDYFIQILCGTKFCKIFWFQFNLIFLSFFFTLLSFITNKKLINLIELFGIISLYIHFSGINAHFFNSYNILIKTSLGTLIEFFSLCSIGCIFSSFNLLIKIKNISFSLQLILFFAIYLLFKFELFISYQGYMYPNVLLNLVSSTVLLLSFGSLNFRNSRLSTNLILFISKFTGGIYYIHPNFIKFVLFFIKIKNYYFSSFINYIFCYLVCFIGNKLFMKTKFKYVFS